MRAVRDGKSLIHVLMDPDSAFRERTLERRAIDLKNKPLEGDSVVGIDDTLFLNGEDSIQMDVMADGDKRGAVLIGQMRESFVMSGKINISDEAVSLFKGLDAGQSQLTGKAALQGLKHSFTPAAGLGRVGRNRTNTKLRQGPSHLG